MNKASNLTDTHAHLDFFGSDQAVEKVISRALMNRVNRTITIADRLESSYRAVELAQKFDSVYAAVGIHPHDAKTVGPNTIKELKELAKSPKVVAIGEIGLDYYRDHSPRPVQQKVFAQLLGLANELELPVVVHDRDADKDVIRIIAEQGIKKGVFHCFSGNVSLAETVLSMNFYISIAGPITFKNSGNLVDVAKFVPLTKLLLETDSPYLTPHPYRGRKNEPAYVRFIAERIADIKGVDISVVEASTQENVSLLFSIPK
ncbi:MAG: TatD family hydrolase [Actinobacteria bacterium]|nr:TatD family hydrolase [Actinomycetota bacterium]